MAMNICQQCQRRFSCDRSDKRFCQASCRWANKKDGPKTPPLPSETMLSLGMALKGAAPQGTVGYRLGLKLAKGMFWFPAQGRRSLRWDGSFSNRPYFVLGANQFEPPKVPKATVYVIHFLDMHGEILATPERFISGVMVAEASRMSWPGTHQVRQVRNGSVRSVVEMGSGRSPGSATVQRRSS